MLESTELAKFIILRASEKDVSLGETKLHKLLYICDGLLLAFGFNLVKDDAKAWNYGPVYPKVHNWLKKNPDAFTERQKCKPKASQKLQEINAQSLVDFVLKHYGTWTASALSLWSHKPGGPWESALARNGGIMNCPIDKTDMGDYFKQFIKDEKDQC
jgi:uncharacterized phage-associated protein